MTLHKITQITKCFFFVSAEIQSYDHWLELWCADGKSTLINAHTANNEEDFQFVPSDIEPKVNGKIKYCYGRTKQLKKSECLTFSDWLQVSQKFSNLIFAMSRENVLTKRGYGYICFPPEYSDVLTTEVRDTQMLLSSELNVLSQHFPLHQLVVGTNLTQTFKILPPLKFLNEHYLNLFVQSQH